MCWGCKGGTGIVSVGLHRSCSFLVAQQQVSMLKLHEAV